MRGREGGLPSVRCWFDFQIAVDKFTYFIKIPQPQVLFSNGAPVGIKISGYLCTVGNNVVVLKKIVGNSGSHFIQSS